MNALERLTAYLCSSPGSEHMDEEYAAFAARLLRQHAHELAEKIRAPHPPESYRPYPDSFEGGADWAADLVEPEVIR